MSLINVALFQSRALIAVDTEAIDYATGSFITAGKMVHLPLSNAIMAGRGTQGYLLVLFALASQFRDADNFDSLAKVMPK